MNRSAFIERIFSSPEGFDLAIIGGSQAALIVGLTLAIGWWAYPLLWLVPVYAFTYCGDQTRFFLEHAYPEPDAAAPGFQIIANPLRSRFGQ